jgi:hypothetical protein
MRPVRDPRFQVPPVGLRNRGFVGEHKAPAPVPHVKPPGRVEIHVTCKDDVIRFL